MTIAIRGSEVSTLLFDLDQTLVVDEAATVAAFAATAALARKSYQEVDSISLATDARSYADVLWQGSQTIRYCQLVGIGAYEALWCRFEGTGVETSLLRQWAPKYRQQIWSLALVDQGVHDVILEKRLAEHFYIERRLRQKTFEDAAPALKSLEERFAFGLVTNGASCLQREKLLSSGLADRFQSVTVSAELGIGKPDIRIFEHSLMKLGIAAHEAIMIGDNLTGDVAGAVAAGMQAIWINRSKQTVFSDQTSFPKIDSLAALPMLLLS